MVLGCKTCDCVVRRRSSRGLVRRSSRRSRAARVPAKSSATLRERADCQIHMRSQIVIRSSPSPLESSRTLEAISQATRAQATKRTVRVASAAFSPRLPPALAARPSRHQRWTKRPFARCSPLPVPLGPRPAPAAPGSAPRRPSADPSRSSALPAHALPLTLVRGRKEEYKKPEFKPRAPDKKKFKKKESKDDAYRDRAAERRGGKDGDFSAAERLLEVRLASSGRLGEKLTVRVAG